MSKAEVYEERTCKWCGKSFITDKAEVPFCGDCEKILGILHDELKKLRYDIPDFIHIAEYAASKRDVCEVDAVVKFYRDGDYEVYVDGTLLVEGNISDRPSWMHWLKEIIEAVIE